jgi:hypothetical protein
MKRNCLFKPDLIITKKPESRQYFFIFFFSSEKNDHAFKKQYSIHNSSDPYRRMAQVPLRHAQFDSEHHDKDLQKLSCIWKHIDIIFL